MATLVQTLNQVGWSIAGRQVRLLALGDYVPANGVPENRLEFLGWRAVAQGGKLASFVGSEGPIQHDVTRDRLRRLFDAMGAQVARDVLPAHS